MTVITVLFVLLGPFATILGIRWSQGNVKNVKDASLHHDVYHILLYTVLPVYYILFYLLRGEGAEPFSPLQNHMLVLFSFVIGITDLRRRIIPNRIILYMLIVWPFTMLPLLVMDWRTAVFQMLLSFLGLLLGGGLFLLVYILSKKGLGGGDVKFVGVLGLYVTVYRVFPVILFGSVFAAVAGIILIAAKKMGRKEAMPFAPFLTLGIMVASFFIPE